jgi:hypothetical protein
MAVLIDPGSPRDPKSIQLATRRGTYIPNERRLEWSPIKMEASVKIWKESHPNAYLRSATAVYNCMGLVFATRRTWIDTDQIFKILKEDDYYAVGEPPEACEGDLVIYRRKPKGNVSHVGIILKLNPEVKTASWEITVLSKWGPEGEYIHNIDDIPEVYGRHVEYWSERRLKP